MIQSGDGAGFFQLYGFTNCHPQAQLPDLQAAGTKAAAHGPVLVGMLIAVHPYPVCPASCMSCTPALMDSGPQLQVLSLALQPQVTTP